MEPCGQVYEEWRVGLEAGLEEQQWCPLPPHVFHGQ